MKKFYISLVRDLLGCYLVVTAESESAVRSYLAHEYFDEESKVWKLPWCSIYESLPPDEPRQILIEKHEPIFKTWYKPGLPGETKL